MLSKAKVINSGTAAWWQQTRKKTEERSIRKHRQDYDKAKRPGTQGELKSEPKLVHYRRGEVNWHGFASAYQRSKFSVTGFTQYRAVFFFFFLKNKVVFLQHPGERIFYFLGFLSTVVQ